MSDDPSSLGNLKQTFNLQGWGFIDDMVRKYGGIVRTWGLFGASCYHSRFVSVTLLNFQVQNAQLYISDPKALHCILIKDQETFEETDIFIEYAHSFFLQRAAKADRIHLTKI